MWNLVSNTGCSCIYSDPNRFDSCVSGSSPVLKEDQNPSLVHMNPFYYNLTIIILSYSRIFKYGSGSGTMALVKTKSFRKAKETFFNRKTRPKRRHRSDLSSVCAANRRIMPEEIEKDELMYSMFKRRLECDSLDDFIRELQF
jgi:hypothetical protein